MDQLRPWAVPFPVPSFPAFERSSPPRYHRGVLSTGSLGHLVEPSASTTCHVVGFTCHKHRLTLSHSWSLVPFLCVISRYRHSGGNRSQLCPSSSLQRMLVTYTQDRLARTSHSRSTSRPPSKRSVQKPRLDSPRLTAQQDDQVQKPKTGIVVAVSKIQKATQLGLVYSNPT